MTDKNQQLPLSRFTVLDLTRVRSGPTAVRQLADWGANVIKIESPAHMNTEGGMGGARHGPDFQNIHRNKRALTLNLKNPEGTGVLMRMVDQADVLWRIFGRMLSVDWELIMNRWPSAIRALSWPVYPGLGNPALMQIDPVLIRWPKVWAG